MQSHESAEQTHWQVYEQIIITCALGDPFRFTQDLKIVTKYYFSNERESIITFLAVCLPDYEP